MYCFRDHDLCSMVEIPREIVKHLGYGLPIYPYLVGDDLVDQKQFFSCSHCTRFVICTCWSSKDSHVPLSTLRVWKQASLSNRRSRSSFHCTPAAFWTGLVICGLKSSLITKWRAGASKLTTLHHPCLTDGLQGSRINENQVAGSSCCISSQDRR